MVGIAAVISIPIGILAATYLAELDPDSRLASSARFLAKVLTGFPSILAGVFVYAILVLAMGSYSAWAGGISLAVLMLPTVVLTAEEAMKTVPRRMKDAARVTSAAEPRETATAQVPAAPSESPNTA